MKNLTLLVVIGLLSACGNQKLKINSEQLDSKTLTVIPSKSEKFVLVGNGFLDSMAGQMFMGPIAAIARSESNKENNINAGKSSFQAVADNDPAITVSNNLTDFLLAKYHLKKSNNVKDSDYNIQTSTILREAKVDYGSRSAINIIIIMEMFDSHTAEKIVRGTCIEGEELDIKESDSAKEAEKILNRYIDSVSNKCTDKFKNLFPLI
jgi:hypothetical protein